MEKKLTTAQIVKERYKRKIEKLNEIIQAKERSMKIHISELDQLRKENRELKLNNKMILTDFMTKHCKCWHKAWTKDSIKEEVEQYLESKKNK